MEAQPNLDKVMRRIQALLNKTEDKGASEAEAQSAANAVAKLMAEYNLDMATLEASGKSVQDSGAERTKEQNDKKCMYKWQRELMEKVAALNYCYHFINNKYTHNKAGNLKKTPVHVLVGRKVNVLSAQMMFDYLCEAIERLVPLASNRERLSRSAMSWKEGCAERVGERLATKRYEQEREQAATVAAAAKAAQGTGQSTGMTLARVAGNEHDANWEFANGYPAGTLAKWRADGANKSLSAVVADREETAEEAKERAKYEEKWRKQQERDRQRSQKEWEKKDHVAYAAGRNAGNTVGLDVQVGSGVASPGTRRLDDNK